jgi:peptide/nickel transport system permease protein
VLPSHRRLKQPRKDDYAIHRSSHRATRSGADLAAAVLVVLGVSVVSFFLTFLTGDPAEIMLPPGATAVQIAKFRAEWGFADPLPVQYWRFLRRAIHGDFGVSLQHGQSSLPLIAARLPATLQLTVTAMLLAIVLAVPLGVLAATHRGGKLDLLTMGVALFGQSVPNFWLAIMMILLFAVSWGWLPTSGRGGWTHVVMPAAAIAINLMALLTRLVRTTMIEVLSEDFVRTGRSKGLRELAVVLRHALPNALIPLVTVVGLQFGYILGGAVVIETIFTWPGVGLFTIQAIMNRDYPVAAVGVAAGLVAGYLGGRVGAVIMRVVDLNLAFPLILLALAVVALLGANLRNLVIVMAITTWIIYARVVRGLTRTLREQEFVQAVRALGARDARIIARHVLPTVLAPIMVIWTLEVARVILMESALSFLGLGVPPPTPTWGRMLAEGRDYLTLAGWISIFPGLAIMVTVLGINFLGDGLRDLRDPRLRGQT